MNASLKYKNKNVVKTLTLSNYREELYNAQHVMKLFWKINSMNIKMFFAGGKSHKINNIQINNLK